jgi:hypothetical protein
LGCASQPRHLLWLTFPSLNPAQGILELHFFEYLAKTLNLFGIWHATFLLYVLYEVSIGLSHGIFPCWTMHPRLENDPN